MYVQSPASLTRLAPTFLTLGAPPLWSITTLPPCKSNISVTIQTKLLSLHYKKTRLLRRKFARENFPCKFAINLQRNSNKKNKILANLLHICDENFSSQICKRFVREVKKVLANLLQICEKTFLSQICKEFARILSIYLVSSQFPRKFAMNLQRTSMIYTFFHILS